MRWNDFGENIKLVSIPGVHSKVKDKKYLIWRYDEMSTTGHEARCWLLIHATHQKQGSKVEGKK